MTNPFAEKTLRVSCGEEEWCMSEQTWSGVAYFKLLVADGVRSIEMEGDMVPFFRFMKRSLAELTSGDAPSVFEAALSSRRTGIELGILPSSHLHGKMCSYLYAAARVYGFSAECRFLVASAFGEEDTPDVGKNATLGIYNGFVSGEALSRFVIRTLLPFQEETVDVRCPSIPRACLKDPTLASLLIKAFPHIDFSKFVNL